MIKDLQQSVNKQLDVAMIAKINFDVSRAPETLLCNELQDLINRLEDEAKARDKPQVGQLAKKDKSKGKKAIIHKRPSKRGPNSKIVDSNPSSSSEKEQGVISPLVKRKRLSEVNRATQSPATQSPAIPTFLDFTCSNKWACPQSNSSEWSSSQP